MTTAKERAVQRLAERPIKASTYEEYLRTLRVLGLDDLPVEDLTVAFLTNRLSKVLTASTRRKHAINLRACLGVNLRCPKPAQKVYDLPDMEELHQALAGGSYAMWGYTMLYAGLRLGEACVKQTMQGNTLFVDRQRLPDGSIGSSKTSGGVVIPAWLSEAYRTFQPDRGTNTVYVGIVRAGRKAGLKITPHMLRHAYATNLVGAGATPEVLRRQMRHHDVSISLRYYVQTTQQDIESVVRRLEAS
jgi:hypothetical protein